MAMEIVLKIKDDGSMAVFQEQQAQEDVEADEASEQGIPVDSIDQALEAIKQMAEEASMMEPPAVGEEEAAAMPAGGDQGGMTEEAAMMGAFKGR